MAIQQNFTDEEQQPGGSTSGGQVLSSDNSAAPVAGSSSGTTPATAPKSGSGFTNLSTYVNANKEQGADMAGKVTGNIQTGIDAAKGLDTNFNKAASSQVPDANSISSNASSVAKGLWNDPTQFTGGAGQSKFTNATSNYNGINDVTSLQPYQDLNNAVTKNAAAVKNLANPYGLQTSVKDAYGNQSNYTQGQNTLDAFLTGSGAGKDKLNQFTSNYNANDPTKSLANEVTGFNNNITKAKDATTAGQQQIQDALKSALTSKTADISNSASKLQAGQAERDRLLKSSQDAIKQGGQAAANALGVDPSTIAMLKNAGIDLNSFVSGTNSGQKLGDVVSAKDQSAYNALQGLSGGSSAFDFAKGSANSGPMVNVNHAGIDQAVNKILAAKKVTDAIAAKKTADANAAAKQQADRIAASQAAAKPAATPQTAGKLLIPSANDYNTIYKTPAAPKKKENFAANDIQTLSASRNT